jgi:putative endonuclease
MNKIPERKVIGNNGEAATAQYLKEEGFTITEMNYRKFYGEIDVIAQKKDLVLFVEVKTRKKNYFDGSLLITPSKQKKIILVAKEYIAKHKLYESICRFDVALVTPEHNHYTICYIPNAFMGE